MTLTTDLAVYQALRQQHTEQIEPQLAQLQSLINQQLDDLHHQEQPLLETQTAALANLRSATETDIRCLLGIPMFQSQVAAWLVNLSEPGNNNPNLSADCQTWMLHDLPFGVQLLGHGLVTDNWAYNDENYYTEYCYELIVQIGSWSKTVSAAVAQLTPGNPMRYSRNSFEEQQAAIANNF